MEKPKKTPMKKPTKVVDFYGRISQLSAELKAPKNQRNNFGKYNYRSCEDILESLKPLLLKYDLHLYISDELKELGGFLYIQAQATLTGTLKSDTQTCSSTAQAGIDPSRKGMDISQSFGSSGSYARKYALNGLFLIDDTKDADNTYTHNKTQEATKKICNAETFEKMLEALGTDFKGETIDLNWITKRYSLNPNQIKILKEVSNG
jgi:hypothetical protein